jgi:hypothetical protein
MKRRLNRTLCLGLPLLGVLLAGVLHLFSLRFSNGDIYPPYSSLRADPLGTKALLDSFAGLREMTAFRWLDPLPRLPGGGRDTALLVLGTPPQALEWMPLHDYKEIEEFMHSGGRVIIAFPPMAEHPRMSFAEQLDEAQEAERQRQEKKDAKPPEEKTPKDKKSGVRRKQKKDEERLPEELRHVELKDRWGVALDYHPLLHDETGATRRVEAQRVSDEVSLPATLAVHTALYFRGLGPQWRTNYLRTEDIAVSKREVGGPWQTNQVRTGLPVIVERSFGRGTLVLCADSYPFSNEALRRDRQPGLLAWAVGANHRVVFDETHLGVHNDPGVAALARRYRLHGFFGALLVLALLYVWKNTSPFIPPHADDDLDGRSDLVEGKDSASGFVNLLRRGIPAGDLLAVCFAEWKKSHVLAASRLGQKRQRMETVVNAQAALPIRERRPAETDLDLSRILNERR